MHEGIGVHVERLLRRGGALIDPLLPEDRLDEFAGRARPQPVVLTSGHHARDADKAKDDGTSPWTPGSVPTWRRSGR